MPGDTPWGGCGDFSATRTFAGAAVRPRCGTIPSTTPGGDRRPSMSTWSGESGGRRPREAAGPACSRGRESALSGSVLLRDRGHDPGPRGRGHRGGTRREQTIPPSEDGELDQLCHTYSHHQRPHEVGQDREGRPWRTVQEHAKCIFGQEPHHEVPEVDRAGIAS